MSRIFDFLSKKIDKEEMESYIDQPKSQFYQIISRAAIIGASVVAIITLLLSTTCSYEFILVWSYAYIVFCLFCLFVCTSMDSKNWKKRI